MTLACAVECGSGKSSCFRERCGESDGSLLSASGGVRNEAYILGDLLLNPHLQRPYVDFQDRAIEAALDHMMQANENQDAVRARVLKAMLMFDTGPGGWEKYLDKSKKLTRKQKRSPRLSHLDPVLATPVMSVMRPFLRQGLDIGPSDVIALAEQKLKHVFMSSVDEVGMDMDLLVQSGFVASEIRDGHSVFVPKCRAVAAGLFVYAAKEVNVQSKVASGTDLSSVQPIHVIRAFFASDKNSDSRVNEGVIMDGATLAQEELGVDSRIMVHFFKKLGRSGYWDQKIHQVINGDREVVA